MLKTLMLRKKLNKAQAELEEHRSSVDFNQREEELSQALEEATTDEEIKVVEEEVEKFEVEKTEFDKKDEELSTVVSELESELNELESKKPDKKEVEKQEVSNENRGGFEIMNKRNKLFGNMTREQMKTFVQREDVHEFLERAKSFVGAEKRGVSNAELNIPTVVLDLLRDNLDEHSKLYKHVNVKKVSGKARQNVLGVVPEAIWTEAVGKLNELDLVFNDVEVDGYKVGGFVPVPNSTLEDADINLANEILTALSKSIGMAVDKSTLYGTGQKMPLGIVTRLAETSQPSYYGEKEKSWTNLSTSNLLLLDPAAKSATDFFADLILKLGQAKRNYSDGNKFWAMNEKTYTTLQSKALVFNATGALVSIANNTLPVVGGAVELLDFIPDGVIIGGYGSLYLLAERDGGALTQSEHAQFIEDNTVFKGTARYDGRPVFGEAFVAIQISQETGATAPKATDVTFKKDTANS